MARFRSLSRRSIVLPLALAGCWSLWLTAGSLAWALKTPERLPYIVRYNSVDGLLGLSVCGLLFLVYSRVRHRLELGRFLFLLFPSCFVAALLWHTASAVTMWGFGWNDRIYLDLKGLLVAGGLSDTITLALFSMLFLAVDHGLRMSAEQEKARRATALAQQAQLQMLRYQLNPHFLFNALNSIRAMILREPERARQIVTELSEFLRYSLNGRGPESTVREELEAIENYLAIQRIRFEERLVVSVKVDPALHDFVLPCFLVHPLVENAVKYGMETSEPPLRIDIEVVARAQATVIRVSNTGRLVSAAATGSAQPRHGTGTGLKNVARRLELAFPGRHTFSLTESDGRVHAEIVLQPAKSEESR